MLRFYFNKKALEAFAKELRRASWGAAAASATLGYSLENGVAVMLGGAAWLGLQILAFALESVKDTDGE